MAFLSIPVETPELTEALEQIMKTLVDLKQDVADQKTVIDSAVALLSGLAAQVAALKPDQAEIDKLAADIEAQTKDLADSVAANTQS